MTYLLIAFGGALGASTRYAIFQLLSHFEHQHLRVGVLVVNVLGSFLIGIALALALNDVLFQRGRPEHLIFITGFLGAFTTFSTFSQDNLELILLEKNGLGFFLNILSNLTLGLVACAMGYFLVLKLFIR